jgi:hypothetical protein
MDGWWAFAGGITLYILLKKGQGRRCQDGVDTTDRSHGSIT